MDKNTTFNVKPLSTNQIVKFCDNKLLLHKPVDMEQFYADVREFLIMSHSITETSTEKEVQDIILDAYYDYFDQRIEIYLSKDSEDMNKKVYGLFKCYSDYPLIQHQVGKVIYKQEINRGDEIYPITIPLCAEADNILQERIKHFNSYHKFAKIVTLPQVKGSKDKNYNVKHGNNLGIQDNLIVADIKKTSLTDKLNQDGHSFVFDRNQVNELLNLNKTLLTRPIYVFHRGQNIVKTSYYVGDYNGQNMLFCERIFYPLDFKETSSYSFGFFAGGNTRNFVFLTRADYGVHHSHFDKLIAGVDTNAKKIYEPFDKFDSNLKYKVIDVPRQNSYYSIENSLLEQEERGKYSENPVRVHPAHIHFTDEVYTTLFPARANHADAAIIPDKNLYNKSFEELYKYSLNHKFRDREDLFDFVNKTSLEEIPDFEHLVRLMKNITNTPSNEEIICKTCTYDKIGLEKLNKTPCKDETILYDLSNVSLHVNSAIKKYNENKLANETEGELKYENK